MGLLAWLESLPLSLWVHESPSVWAQPTVLTLHTMGMAVLVGASWVLDLRLLGISRNIPLSAFRWVFRAVMVGLIGSVHNPELQAPVAPLAGTAFPEEQRAVRLLNKATAGVAPLLVTGGSSRGAARKLILSLVTLIDSRRHKWPVEANTNHPTSKT
jgi:hypothetical protein